MVDVSEWLMTTNMEMFNYTEKNAEMFGEARYELSILDKSTLRLNEPDLKKVLPGVLWR